MESKDFRSRDLCDKALLKPQPGLHVWCSDLNSLLARLNLVTDDSDTISMSSSDSYELEEKMVRFGSVEVREYEVTQGDHPFCKDGLALSLDWNYREAGSFRIKETEENKHIDCKNNEAPMNGDDKCAAKEELRADNIDYINTRPKRLNYFERRLVLEQVGFTVEDCYGDIRSSVWVGVDDELPPDDDDDDDSYDGNVVAPAAA